MKREQVRNKDESEGREKEREIKKEGKKKGASDTKRERGECCKETKKRERE